MALSLHFGLAARWRLSSQGNEENQLQRVPLPIQQAIWLYFRSHGAFATSKIYWRNAVSSPYEAVRRWVNHFGPVIAVDLRRRRSKPRTIWHSEAVYLKIDSRLVYLWRAVDAETRRNTRAIAEIDAQATEELWLCPRQARRG
jgi:hypothetical protein